MMADVDVGGAGSIQSGSKPTESSMLPAGSRKRQARKAAAKNVVAKRIACKYKFN